MSRVPVGAMRDCASFEAEALANPEFMRAIEAANPSLANAIRSRDHSTVQRHFDYFRERRHAALRETIQSAVLSNVDIESEEGQRALEAQIRRRRIEENFEAAVEHNPESFGKIHMLYIFCRVNKHPIRAMVDCGAESTIMSEECARRTGIINWMDDHYNGVAMGVGTSKILGRVHSAMIQVGSGFFVSSVTVVEHLGMDLLLGLDVLRRHQCRIDLEKDALVIGVGDTGVSVHFLSQTESGMSGEQLASLRDAEAPVGSPPKSSSSVPVNVNLNSTQSQSLPRSPAPSSAASAPIAMDHRSIVETMVSMGFDRDASSVALEATNGDIEGAIQLLLSS